MNLRPFLALIFLLSLSLPIYGVEPPLEMDYRSIFYQIKKKLITNPKDLEKLELHGTNFQAQEYLDELLANFWEGLEKNNYFLIFDRSIKPTYRRLSLIRSGKTTLKGFIRISKNMEKCSSYQSLNHSVIKYGQGLGTALQGICGKIATVHSLKKLGLMKAPFNGKYIKEEMLSKVTPKRQQFKGGMTAREVAQAHTKYTKKSCKKYQHICGLDTGKIPFPLQETIDAQVKKGLKIFVANLYIYINSKNPIYDCSLGMTSYNSKGEKRLSHMEHITRVALNPSTKKAIVVTRNGLVQGDMKKTVPANAGLNTISIDPENLECYFEKSTHKGINAVYADTSLDLVEAICCPL